MAVKVSPFGPKPQFVDSSGNPMVGAKLFFYAAGSSTKQNTYTSYTGNTANSNPITLDSRGEPPNEIWFTEGLVYKALLTTASDDPPTSSIWTIDQISGINDATVTADQWIAGPTPTYVSGTSFTLVGDQTATFHVGRRLKTSNTGGTIYSLITNSVFGAVTTVTVENDSGVLDSGLSAVSYGVLSQTNPSIPSAIELGAGTTSAPSLSRQTDENTGLYFPVADAVGLVAGGSEVARARSSGSSFYRRNILTNGSMQINQRQNGSTSADDVYGTVDRWYTLSQSNPITPTQQTLQEDGQPYNVRLTQSNAAAQRMGIAQIVEARDSQAYRGAAVVLSARIRCSSSQAINYAILEWTGTADSVTSDVVLDWTNATLTAGNFFLAANLTVNPTGTTTPTANTWTSISAQVTLSSSLNNLIVFFWTSGTAAQNVTLDIGKVQLEHGAIATEFERVPMEVEISRCQRYYQKSFPYATAPAQNNGSGTGEHRMQSIAAGGGGALVRSYVPYPVLMRTTASLTFYNPAAGNAEARDLIANADGSGTAAGDSTDRGFEVSCTTNAGTTATNVYGVHWAATAEL